MARQDKIKLPKRVAGIKIPKSIRKGPLAQFLNSHAGQVILAEAVVAGAALFTAAKADEDSAVGEGLRHPVDGARRLGEIVTTASNDQSERLAQAFRAAGRAFRAALHADTSGVPQDRRDIDADEEEPRAKKKSGRDLLDTQH